METAKKCENGRNQAAEVVSKDAAWDSFMDSLNRFSDDFLENGREIEIITERVSL